MAEKKEFEKILIQDLRNYNQLDQVAQDKLKTNYLYFHYTRESTAKKILSGEKGCFYIRSIAEMNDLNEKERYGADAERVYALCFSESSDYKDESIPMWFLYGGITGKGVRIGLTCDKLNKLIASIEKVYTIENNVITTEHSRSKGDFTIKYGYVYYYDHVGRIRHKNTTYALIDPWQSEVKGASSEIPFRFRDGNYFIKDYEWGYEKEYRIIFKFEKPVGKQIALFFDKRELLKGLSVQLGPNYLPTDATDELRNEKLRIKAAEFGLSDKKMRNSYLRVRMNLLDINKSVIAEDFATISKKLETSELNAILTEATDAKLKIILKDLFQK